MAGRRPQNTQLTNKSRYDNRLWTGEEGYHPINAEWRQLAAHRGGAVDISTITQVRDHRSCEYYSEKVGLGISARVQIRRNGSHEKTIKRQQTGLIASLINNRSILSHYATASGSSQPALSTYRLRPAWRQELPTLPWVQQLPVEVVTVTWPNGDNWSLDWEIQQHPRAFRKQSALTGRCVPGPRPRQDGRMTCTLRLYLAQV